MEEEGRPVSAKQWEALRLVVARADGQQATYVVKSPQGDAAINRRTAAALFRRGFINVTDGDRCWPTPAGRTAMASRERIESRRKS